MLSLTLFLCYLLNTPPFSSFFCPPPYTLCSIEGGRREVASNDESIWRNCMLWGGAVPRLRTLSLQCAVLSVLYFHCLFAMALLGQNIIATVLLVVHLACVVRYVSEQRQQQQQQEQHLEHADERYGGTTEPSTREEGELLLLSLPPQPLLYLTVAFSAVQLLLAAALGPLLGKLGLLQGKMKILFNSIGAWGADDVFPLVVNVASASLLATISVALSVVIRRRCCRPSRGTPRSFHRWSLMRLAVLTLVTALIYPSYDYAPLLAIHFLCMASFLMPWRFCGKVRFLEVMSKGCTVFGLLLLGGSLTVQSPLLQWLFVSEVELSDMWGVLWYESRWVNMFASAVVFRKGTQFLLLVYTIAASRRVHGRWHCITRNEMVVLAECADEAPFLLWHLLPLRCAATAKKVQLAVGHYLPMAVVPVLVIVSVAVMDVVSILMLVTSLLGFVLAPAAFVAVLPHCYILIALGIFIEFIALVESRLRLIFFMSQATTRSALLGTLLMQCGVAALLVLAVSLFRGNPIQSYYRTLPEKKAHIRKAFNHLHYRLRELQEIFTQVCDSSSGVVSRSRFMLLVEQVSHTLCFREDDMDALWRFLTEGEQALLLSTDAVGDDAAARAPPAARTPRSLAGRGSPRPGVSATPVTTSDRGCKSKNEDEEEEEEVNVKGWDEVKQHLLAMQLVDTAEEPHLLRNRGEMPSAASTLTSREHVVAADAQLNSEEHATSRTTQSKGQRARESSVSLHAFSSGGENVAYFDFLVLVSEIEWFCMRRRRTVYVFAAMMKQIVYLNISTLFLVAMFAVSMTVKRLDFLNGMYFMFFLILACLTHVPRRYWSVIVAYTMLHITVLFTVLAYTRSYYPGGSPAHWVEIIGIYSNTNRFVILVYFVLLVLAVFQMRFSRREECETITIQEILQRVEWRRYVSCAFFPQLCRHFLTLTTTVVLVIMTLFIPRNVFIAGFAFLFLPYLTLGVYSQRAESIALVVLTAYTVSVLLLSALYHVPDVSDRILVDLSNVTACRNITVAVCASEIGVPMNDRFGPVSLDLLLWFLAAALGVALCRQQFGGRREARGCGDVADDIHSRGGHHRHHNNNDVYYYHDNDDNGRLAGREMDSICEPLVVNNDGETCRVVEGPATPFLPTLRGKVLFSRCYADMRGTFTGRCVPMALEVTRYFYIVVAFIFELGVSHGSLFMWISVGYASLSSFSVLGAAFMALFLCNSRGMPVMVVAVVNMALNYVYPFFFIPEVPLPVSARRFLGLEKSHTMEELSILPPLLACVMAAFHEHTRRPHAVRVQKREEREARMREDPRHRTEQQQRQLQAGHSLAQDAATSEELQTPYVEFTPSEGKDNQTNGTNEVHISFSTGQQHVLFLWNYMRTRFLVDAAFELTAFIVVLGLALTLDRVTGFIFCFQFLLMWLIGRVRSTTELQFAIAQELLMALPLGVLYLIRLGMPEGVLPLSILHSEQCGPWEHYFGCDLPVHHFILMFALVLMQRHMRQAIGEVRATIPCVDGSLEMGELLRKKARDVEDCRKFLRSDIENVLPVPSRDIIRNPQTVFDLLIAIACAFLPAATFAFVQGVMMASLQGVVESVTSLCLLAFGRFLAWRWHQIWPYFTLFLLLTFVPQLVVRLPVPYPLETHTMSVMRSLGVSPWSQGMIIGQSLVLFSAVVQQRLFSEFFFAAYLIGLFKDSLTAIERRNETLDYIRKRSETLKKRVEEQQRALRKKLEQLFAERNMQARCVDVVSDAAYGEEGEYLYGSRAGTLVATPTYSQMKSPLGFSGCPASPFAMPSVRDQEEQQQQLQQHQQQRQELVAGRDGKEPVEASIGETLNAKRDGAESEAPASDVFSVEGPHFTSAGSSGCCVRAAAAMREWSERAVQYLACRTYRGKVPQRTYSQGYRLLVAFMQFLLRKSSYVCYFLFMLNYALSGTLLDMLLSVSAALHGMLMLPWAGRNYWRNVLIYNVVSILAKCVIQVLVQQFSMRPDVLYVLSACVLDIGLNRTEPSSRAMMLDIIMDFVVFVSIILHRQLCFDYGMFGEECEELARHRRSRPEIEGGCAHTNSSNAHSPEERTLENSVPDDNDGDVYHQTEYYSRASSAMLKPSNHGDTNTNHGAVGDSVDSDKCDSVGGGDCGVFGWAHRIWRGGSMQVGGILQTYWRNICERHGAGSDCYTVQFWVDSLSLIVFVAVYFVLAGYSRGSIFYSVQQDLLPGPLVVILFLGILTMAAERVVYVLHSVYLKFGLHVFTALIYHVGFMLWRLTLAQRATTPAVILLMLKFFSMHMSALQLRKGYPLHRKHDPFTTNTDIFHWLGHMVFRAIPFLFELRLLLDWSVSPTTLKVQHWMLIEDVHHTIYLRYVDMSDLAWTSPRKGRRFPFFVRAYQGILGFAACLLVLFFPLMLYSTFNPNVGANHVVSWRTEMTFSTLSRFYTAEDTDAPVPLALLPGLAETVPLLQQDGFGTDGSLQLLTFPRCSAEVWSATPETRLLLLGQLTAAVNNETSFVINKHDDVLRLEASAGAAKRLRVSHKYVVPWSTVVKLRDALEKAYRMHNYRRLREETKTANSDVAFVYQSSEWISLPLFYSPFVKNIPSNVVVPGYAEVDCAVQLNSVAESDDGSVSVLYWCFRCESYVNLSNTRAVSDATAAAQAASGVSSVASHHKDDKEVTRMAKVAVGADDNTTGLYEVVASSDVTLDTSFSFLPNTGIIALYTTFILALGTFLRNAVTGYAHRVVLMQVSNPDPVAELLRYIYMARSSASNGYMESLLLEQQLFFELVDLLRSPERVLTLSGRRVEDYDSSGKFQQHLKKLSDHPF